MSNQFQKIKGYKIQKKCSKCRESFSTKDHEEIHCDKCRGTPTRENKVPLQNRKAISPKLTYSFELFKLNKRTLSKLEFMNNRRKIYGGQAGGITTLLRQGQHFDSPIVVNEAGGRFRVIDGNHRIEAFKRILKSNPEYSLPILLIKYKDLDDDGEIMAYRKWNIGKAQSLEDFIQTMRSKLPIVRWMLKEFSVPVSIYPRPGYFKIRQICSAYLSAIQKRDDGYAVRRTDFIQHLKELGEGDYNWMTRWMKEFVSIFGDPSAKNAYAKAVFLYPATYLKWEFDDDPRFLERMRENVLGDPEVLELCKLGGKEANKMMVRLLKDKLKLKPNGRALQ